MSNRLKIITSIVVVAVVLLVIYLSRQEPIPIVLKTVQRGEVNTTVANTRAGTVNACRRAQLSPAIGGQIASLPVSKGESVKAGQVLLEMWNDDRIAEVDLAQQQAQASIARAKEACVMAGVAKREALRLTKLREKGLTSAENADRAESDAKARSAACEAAQANTHVSAARLNVAKASLARTRLVAPFDSTVAEINGELGEFITPSPVGVATLPSIDLIDNTCLYVTAPIDEVDAPSIRAEMQAWISLDAFQDKRFAGKVRRVASYVLDREKQARTVDIEVDFVHPEEISNLLPGYSADVEVVLATRNQVLRIPTESILEGNQIMVYDKDNDTLEQRTFEAGLSNWEFTQVLSGLEEGDQIVISLDREGVVDGAYVIPEHASIP